MKVYHYSETSVHAGRVVGNKAAMMERDLPLDSPDFDSMTLAGAIVAAKAGTGVRRTADFKWRAACGVLDYFASRGSGKASRAYKKFCDYCG